jgi:hypothetical protein
MATIPKNARKIGQLKEELTDCRVYSLSNQFIGKPCGPEWAWKALQTGLRAKLTTSGQGVYTVRVHDNLWYELTTP